MTTQLRKPLSILWLPLCRINKLGFTFLEDCCDLLHLWVIIGALELLHHSVLGVPMCWYTHSCCHQDTFLVPVLGIYTTIQLHHHQACANTAWGGCITLRFSCPLDTQRNFLLFVFLSFLFFWFLVALFSVLVFQFFLHTKSIKNV